MPDRLLAEYASEDAIVRAIHDLRELGYQRIEAYLPFPSHEVEAALGQQRSRLPVAIFLAGMTGAGTAYFLQWLLNAKLYPLVVGGRPPHLPLPFLIITFEMGVLFGALCAFFGVLRLGRLLRLVDEVQTADGFESVTRDRFWLEVSMADPIFEDGRTRAELARTGAIRIEIPEEAP
jgi:hypothetical protein